MIGSRVSESVNIYAPDGDRGIPVRPPPGFVKRLQAYDRDLVVGFNAGAGWRAPYGRWIIGRKRMQGQGIGHVMTVQESDGTFLALGEHVLENLRRIDSFRIGRSEQLRQLDAIFESEAQARNEDLRQHIRSGLDKMAWALRKDVDRLNLSHIGAGDLRAEERRIEMRGARLDAQLRR